MSSATDVAICTAVPADLERVAAIFAHYVTGSVVTFEDTPPSVADWRRRPSPAGRRGPPAPGREDRRGGRRVCLRRSVAAEARLPAHGRGLGLPGPRPDRPGARP